MVRFIPGSLDFGYLHDDERPLVSSVSRSRRMKWTSSVDQDPSISIDQDKSQQEAPLMCDATSQTEPREDTVDAGVET